MARQTFTITDKHHRRHITAKIAVDTNIADYDKLEIESVKDERGNDVFVTEELREQLFTVFMQEKEAEYNALLEAVAA